MFVCYFQSSDKNEYLWEVQQVHAPDVKAFALTMLIQEQQVLLSYQQINSPSLSFLSSSTKASEGTEQRFPLGPQTGCLNLVPGSELSFLFSGFGSLCLSSEEVAHGTSAAKLCNIQYQSLQHSVLHTGKPWQFVSNFLLWGCKRNGSASWTLSWASLLKQRGLLIALGTVVRDQ